MESETVKMVVDHIKSFEGRRSHYSLGQSQKIYLDQDLSIRKMHNKFAEEHPTVKCSYDSYRSIFNTRFNLSFGFPRSDTCSTCDEFKVKIAAESDVNLKNQLENERNDHQNFARLFFIRKKLHRRIAMRDSTKGAIAFDFWKNLPCPNVTTNDVYYRRQLSVYTFNVHDLGRNTVHLYSYDETTAKKGSDDVCSMLYDFFMTKLPQEVTTIDLFCDNCGGQNKNWTMFRFLYTLVHILERFELLTIHFPIRGHSYLECDKDMGVVNQKAECQVPSDWYQQFRIARKNPAPYNVIEMKQDQFLAIGDGLKPIFKLTSPIPTRNIRELRLERGFSGSLMHRDNWNGRYDVTEVLRKRRGKQPKPSREDVVFKKSYKHRVAVSKPKFMDIQHLKKFCSAENQEFFAAIPVNDKLTDMHEPVHDEMNE